LWLDENIVQQLNEDLFSLESSDGLFFETAGAENRAADRETESRETAASSLEDVDLGFTDPLAQLDGNQPPASLDNAQSPEPQAWDNLT
jgi:hypothetical protein